MTLHKLRIPFSTGTLHINLNQPVRHVNHPSDTHSLNHGNVIQYLGHLYIWDEHSVPEDVVVNWQMEGDPLCDAALIHLLSNNSPSGLDMLHKLQNFVAKLDAHDNASAASTFWKAITKVPPVDIWVSDEQFE
ncbi:hypothetical protein Moror_13373 [Moniliophthora roreri MCA 2997]|uniref:Uncharacterized protein n=2 Tax=Moniliophthora roreri TaxID=221103 RepID=V2XNK9_MONRO|nr:hypothetical protein Moror_13373 [Moniliophthora roreri MCA 2997]